MSLLLRLVLAVASSPLVVFAAEPAVSPAPTWSAVQTIGLPHARHEAAFIGHGSGLVRLGDTLYVAAGSGSRGGKPELDSLESFELPRR